MGPHTTTLHSLVKVSFDTSWRYTFVRQNEVIRTGKDPNGGDTTGPMVVNDDHTVFAQYEMDVGYWKNMEKREDLKLFQG